MASCTSARGHLPVGCAPSVIGDRNPVPAAGHRKVGDEVAAVEVREQLVVWARPTDPDVRDGELLPKCTALKLQSELMAHRASRAVGGDKPVGADVFGMPIAM